MMLSKARSNIRKYSSDEYRSVENGYFNTSIQKSFAKMLYTIVKRNRLINKNKIGLACKGISGITLATTSSFLYPDVFTVMPCNHFYRYNNGLCVSPPKYIIFIDDYISLGHTVHSVINEATVNHLKIDRIVVINISCSYRHKYGDDIPIHILTSNDWLKGSKCGA